MKGDPKMLKTETKDVEIKNWKKNRKLDHDFISKAPELIMIIRKRSQKDRKKEGTIQ